MSYVEVDAQTAVLRGRPIFDRIRIVDPVVDLTKVAGRDSDGARFRGLGSLQAGDVSVDNLFLVVGTPDTARLTIRKLSLKGSGEAPGRLRLESASPGSLLVELADARLPFDTLAAAFVIDGDGLTISRLEAGSGTARVEARGRVRFDRDYPIDVDYDASVDLSRAAGWWHTTSTMRGHLTVSGRVIGPLLSPTATARADAAGFAWSALSPGRLTADGLITGSGVQVKAFTLDVPEAAARGKGFLSWSDASPRSTLNASWSASLLRQLGPLIDLKPESIPLVSAEGTAVVNWPGFVPDLATLAGTLETRVSSGDPAGDDHGIVNMVGGDTRWQVDWRQRLPGETTARGRFAVRIDPLRFGQSALDGTLELSTANAAFAMRRIAGLDIAIPDVFLTRLKGAHATLTGPVAGSVTMPQWHAALQADDVVVSGLRGIEVDGTIDVDPRRLATDGLALKAPGSQVRMSGTIGILEAGTDVSFDGVIDADWASAPFVPAAWPIGGRASVKGRWVTSDDASNLDVSLESSAATLATRAIEPIRGRVHADLAAVTGSVSIPELGCRFSGTYDPAERQAPTARAECRNADAVRWLELGGAAPALTEGIRLSVDGTVEASGPFENLDAVQFTVSLDTLSGSVRGHAADPDRHLLRGRPLACPNRERPRDNRGARAQGARLTDSGFGPSGVEPRRGTGRAGQRHGIHVAR